MVLILDEDKHMELKKAVDQALEGTVGRHLISVLFRQNHNAILVSYNVRKFPTLLIFDSDIREVVRITDKDLLTLPFFKKALSIMGAV